MTDIKHIIVDPADEILFYQTPEQCLLQPEAIRRAVHVFVINQKDQIVMRQLLSENRETLLSSASDYVRQSESYSHAARRVLRDQLGLEIAAHTIDKFHLTCPQYPEIATLYTCQTPGPFRYNQQKISGLVYLNRDEIKAKLKQQVSPFLDNTRLALQQFLVIT